MKVCVVLCAPALFKVTKLEVSTEVSRCLIVSIGALNHRVVGVLHLSDGAGLTIANVEAVVSILFPGVACKEASEDARVAVWVLDLDHVALAGCSISCWTSVEAHIDWYVPELTCHMRKGE